MALSRQNFLPALGFMPVLGIAALLALSPVPALSDPAATCPGHPDALGTSRTLVVDPTAHPRIGTMQYHETLPLRDHEVVLTFDDGPLPPYTTRVLDALASECVKATFFIVGRMARAYPATLKKVHEAGHTIGTHSLSHPLTFHHMGAARAEKEIMGGIEFTTAALGDAKAVAPFFRIPGLLRADDVEAYLASRKLMTWSADFLADDWRHISAAEVTRRALSRLEAKGKGILLLHDIQPATALALPGLLRELKARGYRIVHVVPATPELPATPTEPEDWQKHHPGMLVASTTHWPAIPPFVFSAATVTAVPALASSGAVTPEGHPLLSLHPADSKQRIAVRRNGRHGRIRNKPLRTASPWPARKKIALPKEFDDVLPVPSLAIYRDLGKSIALPATRAPRSTGELRRRAMHAASTPLGESQPERRTAVETGKLGGWPVAVMHMQLPQSMP